MPRFAQFLLLAALTVPAIAVTAKLTGPEKITVAQLEQALAAAQGKPDAELAQQLSNLGLIERLSPGKLARWQAELPGEKSRQSLLILADQSAFLPPPDAELAINPAPGPASTRQMLVQVVNYVNTTARQLPNFLATRQTTGFEDRPKEDRLDAIGTLSVSYLPLHLSGRSTATVTYRDRKEVVEEEKEAAAAGAIGGLATAGEFGPILSTVVADALKGKITWARWEQGAAGPIGVFHFAVPAGQSNYHVRFCCVVEGYSSDGLPEKEVFDERSAYQGEIVFDPDNGTILRISIEADLPPHELVARAGMEVEYGPIEIAGKTFIAPLKSVSLLEAHTAQQQGAISRSDYRGDAKTFLNDVVFGQYRRFGSEMRILPADAEPPAK